MMMMKTKYEDTEPEQHGV